MTARLSAPAAGVRLQLAKHDLDRLDTLTCSRSGGLWAGLGPVRRMVLGPPCGQVGPTLDAALLLKLPVDFE
ncbi:MAG: hypothetical protein DCF18_11725 [Cyanobium sp.]|uniref:hypothetical protein n=1 Tax=Synechococcus sp. CS-1333 TaxID=2848638 RepID=UPI000DBBB487|nr:hypothetical protein [Synechococcus sp. CS-1333]MCT0211352.1 hypothetical protein [Synechococcus sp. CS-1333]PZV21636.1 MAG: hypothetical protein DCF18_11725 [Cyanobium sp.]